MYICIISTTLRESDTVNKKKLLLLVSITSMCAVVGTVFVPSGGLDETGVFALNRNRGTEVWHHYAAVESTETIHGSKEFWAKESEGCSTPYFEDPEVECVDHDFSTYESFSNMSTEDERFIPSLNQQKGIDPCYYPTSKIITYGLYPQTNINDVEHFTLVENLDTYASSHAVEANGWYLYNGEYYATVQAHPHTNNYSFDNGVSIVSNDMYWFKCEPIVWNVLSNNSGECYSLSSLLLDVHRYNESYSGIKDGHYANNYEYSEVRSWLNNNFYNSAFALNSNSVLTTVVDNSAATTKVDYNTYVCNNTNDKVFLPSYKDYFNDAYGFTSKSTRICVTTDYARAIGVNVSGNSNNGDYWSRSPSHNDTKWAALVSYDGDVYNDTNVDYSDRAVRPAITVKIA